MFCRSFFVFFVIGDVLNDCAKGLSIALLFFKNTYQLVGVAALAYRTWQICQGGSRLATKVHASRQRHPDFWRTGLFLLPGSGTSALSDNPLSHSTLTYFLRRLRSQASILNGTCLAIEPHHLGRIGIH